MMSPAYRLSEIAERLGLPVQGVDAGDDILVTGVNTLEEAGPSELSFLSNPKYTHQLSTTRAGAVIVRPEQATGVKRALISNEPYPAFAHAIGLFATPQGTFSGISPMSSIHPDAVLGQGCTVYPFAYVGARTELGDGCILFPGAYVGEDSRLGKGCILHPNSVIMANCTLGDACLLQPGAVVGGEGYGFVRTPEGIRKIPQIGRVEIGHHVEIGVNSAVDRAALSATKLGDRTSLDNLVQVGHNVHLGKDCLIVSQAGVAGSTRVGDNVTIAGQVGVGGHLHIGNNVTIGPQSGVAKDVADNLVVGGTPTVDYTTYLRTMTLMPRFPELFKRLSKLEKKLEALTSASANTSS